MTLSEKKARVLMIIIWRMIARLQQISVNDDKLFRLFEDAKVFHYSKDERSFQAALDRMDPPVNPMQT